MLANEFDEFLKIYSIGIRGREATVPEDIDLDSIYFNAANQNAMVIIYHAIDKLYGERYASNNFYKMMRHHYLKSYVANCQKQEAALSVLRRLRKKGFSFRIIKGMCLSILYDDPMVRNATDVDMLVDKEDLEKTIVELKNMGFSVKAEELDKEEKHHVSCFHPKAGYFEVHHKFYDEYYDEVWFKNKFSAEEEYTELEVGDIKIQTLGITDGFIFNYLHMIKHFLLTGITIQQIADILLYSVRYKDEINWERVNGLISSLGYKKFLNGVMTIGELYMDFDKDELPRFEEDKKSAENILKDLEAGGAYGSLQRRERDKFYHTYTKRKFENEKKEISYEKYILDKKHISLMTKIFSRKKILESRYPFLIKKPWLLPVAWVMRWMYGLKIILNKKITFKEYINTMPDKKNDVINERMEIVEDLGML